ncbi:MAG: response regulator [Rhodoferax sp.]|nr:response regulator [Rhodoferax sp.]
MISSILVVDDSKSSRKVNVALIRELVGSEVTCLEATGGEHALQILTSQHVDLVLLDLTMPGVSGFDVLAEMRRQNLNPRVIVVSADIQRLAKERVAALGATGFIDKPIRMEPLRAMLSHLGVIHG